MDRRKSAEAPKGVARVVRTALELSRLARAIVPAYAKGNASVEGYVRLARDPLDGTSPAPERSRDRLVRLPIGTIEPLAQAIDHAFGIGELVAGVLKDGKVEVRFESLTAPIEQEPRRVQRDEPRGGVIAVMALDADGAPVERAGELLPDPRTAIDVARGLDVIRRRSGLAMFSLDLRMTRGGVGVRVLPDVALIVVVEKGVDIAKVMRLVPDVAVFAREAPVTGLTESILRSASRPSSPQPKAASTANGHTNGRGKSTLLGWATSRVVARFDAATVAFDPVRVLLRRKPALAKLARPVPVREAAPPRAPSAPMAAPATSAPEARIGKRELEEATTGLLRAAEEYLGPRILDRIITETSPGSWSWENRRVAVRAAERVPALKIVDVYRDVKSVFARGGEFSDALRSFDFDAWLGDASFAPEHLQMARTALTGRAAA